MSRNEFRNHHRCKIYTTSDIIYAENNIMQCNNYLTDTPSLRLVVDFGVWFRGGRFTFWFFFFVDFQAVFYGKKNQARKKSTPKSKGTFWPKSAQGKFCLELLVQQELLRKDPHKTQTSTICGLSKGALPSAPCLSISPSFFFVSLSLYIYIYVWPPTHLLPPKMPKISFFPSFILSNARKQGVVDSIPFFMCILKMSSFSGEK